MPSYQHFRIGLEVIRLLEAHLVLIQLPSRLKELAQFWIQLVLLLSLRVDRLLRRGRAHGAAEL